MRLLRVQFSVEQVLLCASHIRDNDVLAWSAPLSKPPRASHEKIGPGRFPRGDAVAEFLHLLPARGKRSHGDPKSGLTL